ncbi:L,D-transpeptidase [Mesorhizobium delmotii]|uniref:ErfK/YbiS/YcfS/YnhG n=1 Tax=Mesorhizobium delmotii TaxID=1631247 RepID=A0A2P9ARB6_9HYPH|nr:L,D-transpeptidase [Mesorhizobium delmotii]SJM33689.1 ErfK/YbiS/YcfS/YnhG [Mesorhizobium delmotii]
MATRRAFLLGIFGAIAAPGLAWAHKRRKPFVLDPVFQPQLVEFPGQFKPGAIVVDPAARFLYLVEDLGAARRYGVGVGKAGLAFKGRAVVGRKVKWPSWRPTDNMIRRNPSKYARYAGGMKGGSRNPLGSRALYLYRAGRDTFYRIHGTTEPWTIGRAVSNGCIRMLNEHVKELYERVPIGAEVIVL